MYTSNQNSSNQITSRVTTVPLARTIERKQPSPNAVVSKEIIDAHWELPDAQAYREASEAFDKAAEAEFKIASELELTVTTDYRTIYDGYKASLRDGRKSKFQEASQNLNYHLDKTERLKEELRDARRATRQADARMAKLAGGVKRIAASSRPVTISQTKQEPVKGRASTLEEMLGAKSSVFNANGKVVAGISAFNKLDPTQQQNINHSMAIFVIDKQGRERVFLSSNDFTPAQLTADLQTLLKE